MTGIEWTDATWNPVTGCTKVSAGCKNCYAERVTKLRPQHFPKGFGVHLRPERLDQPLHWRKPRMVFVNSMSDLFHEDVPDEFLAYVFLTMQGAPHHIFQILTKRPDRMRDWFMPNERPLPNVWLGVSAEDQKTADERIPYLLETPAVVRFVSLEPLLGPIKLRQDWKNYLEGWDTEAIHVCGGDEERCYRCCPEALQVQTRALDWVIVGGESGPRARPIEAAWVESLRDQCEIEGVPFFFKQWGGPTPKAGGRLLDGRTWDEMPAPAKPTEVPR